MKNDRKCSFFVLDLVYSLMILPLVNKSEDKNERSKCK